MCKCGPRGRERRRGASEGKSKKKKNEEGSGWVKCVEVEEGVSEEFKW